MAVIERNIFDELFVLEVANNHWGSLDRGLRIVRDFATVARYQGIRCAIKLQFRDVDQFIHVGFRDRQDIRYIKKTIDTQLSDADFATLVEEIRRNNCIRMSTPFDERSVDLFVELGIDIIKIASSDITDWPLLEKIAQTKKPVIASTGGASVKDMDAMVTFFGNRGIPLAINHCVSLYPSEAGELELNQIDFLRKRYPGLTIGWSGHETSKDIEATMLVAYAKGARTFERHIDIVTPDKALSPYCSTPEAVSDWFAAFNRAKSLCGGRATIAGRWPARKSSTSTRWCAACMPARSPRRRAHHARGLLPRRAAAEGTDIEPGADRGRCTGQARGQGRQDHGGSCSTIPTRARRSFGN